MKTMTAQTLGRQSVSVATATHARLQALKAETGITITRLIDQAVSSLAIARKKHRKPLD